jgi:predicted HD phosphohydrolase
MSAACNQLNISRTQLGKTLKENYENFVKSKEHNANSIDMLKLRFEGKKMPAAIADEITRLENELKFSRWAIFDSYDDKVRVAVIHEYGHIIADQYFGQINGKDANPNYTKDTRLREMVKKWDDAFIKALQNGDIYNLSRYGRTNAEEFFAECFVAREMGEQLPDYVEELMKEVLNNGIM